MGRTHSTTIRRRPSDAITTNAHAHRLRRFAGAVVIGALALTACGADDDDADASDEPASEEFVDDGGFGEFEEPADEPAAEPALETDAPRTGGAAAEGVPLDFGRDIITEVGLTMTTSNVAQAADDVRRLAVNNGGAVFSSDITIGDVLDDGSVPGGGRIEIRIPPQDLDRLVTALDGLGGVTRLSQDSEDVTDQLVDLGIRIRQARSSIERIESILEQTTELDDVFTIEAELNRRQVELERLLAQQRSTQDRVALATLNVDIEYRAPDLADQPPVDDERDDGIADAFRSGWDAFVGVLFALGFVLALTAPFLATGLVVGGAIWLVARVLRRRHERPSARATRPAADDGTGVGNGDRDVADDRDGGALSDSVDEPSLTT